MDAQMVAVSVIATEEDLRISQGTSAFLEAEPKQDGFELNLVIMGIVDGLKKQVRTPFRTKLKYGAPMIKQFTHVHVVTGDYDDIEFVLFHCDEFFEAPAGLGAFEGLITNDNPYPDNDPDTDVDVMHLGA